MSPRALLRIAAGPVFALLVLACALAAPAVAVEIKEVKSPGGITAWLIEDGSVPLVSMEFAFRGGAALDPEGKAGLAELVSGLLDEGAGPLDSAAFQARLENNSITLGFSAGPDSFGGRLRALNEDRAAAFDLLRLALTEPRFDAEPVARMKGQLLAEIEREAERPRHIAEQTWIKTVFPDHPYGRDADGTRMTIPVIGEDDLRGFVKTRFARDNLIVGVVGDITPEALGPLLDRAFGALPEKAAPFDLPPAEVKGEGTVLVIERNIPQTVTVFGQEGLLRQDPDFYAAMVMNYILGGGGLTSRLANEVREKRGLAYSVSTQLVTHDKAGLIKGGVATQNARVAESLDLIRAEWARMAETPVSMEELEDAKNYLTGSYFTRLNSTSRIAALLAGLQLEGFGRDYLDKRDGLIRAVTAADVQRVARRLLKPDALTVVMVGKPQGVAARP